MVIHVDLFLKLYIIFVDFVVKINFINELYQSLRSDNFLV